MKEIVSRISVEYHQRSMMQGRQVDAVKIALDTRKLDEHGRSLSILVDLESTTRQRMNHVCPHFHVGREISWHTSFRVPSHDPEAKVSFLMLDQSTE